MCFISLSSAPRFNTYCPTTQPSSSMTLLDLCLTVDTFCVPKKTAEEYTAIPDIPALRTSYPGLDEVEGGEEEIWTLWIPSKASISYLSGCAEIHQMLLDSSWDDLVCGRMTLTCVGIKHLRCRKHRVTYCNLKSVQLTSRSFPLSEYHIFFSLQADCAESVKLHLWDELRRKK